MRSLGRSTVEQKLFDDDMCSMHRSASYCSWYLLLSIRIATARLVRRH